MQMDMEPVYEFGLKNVMDCHTADLPNVYHPADVLAVGFSRCEGEEH
ncbi:hypothetical protein G5B39_18550 (plasmid) [Rhodobacteraceae bacterium SC52]|nr:hypothetical protein G5B39_18550 [Rhodobacteraceae bacterium SC52]